MSGLLPIFPGQLERWAEPRPEPVTLELPGWKRTDAPPDDTFPNQRSTTFEREQARIQVTRTWDQPRNPGYPMAAESERPFVVGGREVALVTTRIFDGVPKRVLVFWLRGKGHDVDYTVRVVLYDCDGDWGDDVLRLVAKQLVIHW